MSQSRPVDMPASWQLTQHGDERGYLVETHNRRSLAAHLGYEVDFVQDNRSLSNRNVLRGLHYQLPPNEQGKLVSVAMGSVFDVVVDIRKGSPSFAEWWGFDLSEDNGRQLWVPPGFAHGFYTTSESAIVTYKMTGYYDERSERSIRWDDPDISIDWPTADQPILSAKDARAPLLAAAETFELDIGA